MANERNPLESIILSDLLKQNKIPLLLVLGILATAIATIWVTQQTRLLTIQKGKLEYANKALSDYYVHLQLEEDSLSRRERVEKVATDNLGLSPVKKEQEVILVK